MALSIVRLGSPRLDGEGLRIGTVRYPPRGVRKEDYAREDYYDVWFPNLAPSSGLLREAREASDEKSWKAFSRNFEAEMEAPEASKDLDLLAALSHHTELSIGCYCEDENRCHRSILKELLLKRGARVR